MGKGGLKPFGRFFRKQAEDGRIVERHRPPPHFGTCNHSHCTL